MARLGRRWLPAPWPISIKHRKGSSYVSEVVHEGELSGLVALMDLLTNLEPISNLGLGGDLGLVLGLLGGGDLSGVSLLLLLVSFWYWFSKWSIL